MRKRLDHLDMNILKALGIYGPRSLSKVAKELDVPTSTVRDRVTSLKSRFSLVLHAKVYHTFIGLKKAFVFARAAPGYERLLWESMQANGYWLYMTARYDMAESFYAIYGIPIHHTEEFEEFVKRMRDLKIAQSVDLVWSTCIHDFNLTDDWRDRKSERWIFKWDDWTKEIGSQGTSLPSTLVETDSYPQKADHIDIIIIKELQKDAECKLNHIADMLNVSPETVRYHLENHVVAKGLIEGYTALLSHFEAVSDNYCFRFDFPDESSMARFALSFEGKPFARSAGKIFGESALLVNVYLPRKEFRGFTDSLSRLIREGLLQSYDYAVEDVSRKQVQTIPYEFFRDDSWIYSHKEHIEKLQELSECIN